MDGRGVTTAADYSQFIQRKVHEGADHGFDPVFMPGFLFAFQAEMVDWAVRKGRAALFEDCGMGKTPQLLAWAQNIVERTNRGVLILTPLAVAAQTIREAGKFGIDAVRSHDGTVPHGARIVVTNYERLHHFDPDGYAAVVCDESSILKSFDGARRGEITAFMRKVPYRLLTTATAAPNDYFELGTSSEALGWLGHMDMLNRFFKNDQGNSSTKRFHGEAPKWRLKGHAEQPFWRWVCSWARALRKPSDLGHDDDGFVLPPLTERVHLVEPAEPPEGALFTVPASTLLEQRQERRRTLSERCEQAARLVDTGEPALMWCHLNDEGDLLEQLIPDAVQVSGKDSDRVKEERLMAFADGEIRVLVTKPQIGAWGLNFQRCAHVTFFPSHSYEQYYQAVRRCWRFGQERPVVVDLVMTEGERRVMENLQRKAQAADRMFENLVAEMRHAISLEPPAGPRLTQEAPPWL